MQCPYCNSSTKVTNSRTRARNTQTWRRRKCSECHKIWTTTEMIDLSTSHKVGLSEKQLQPFSRDKLYLSIKDSLQHRKTALEDASALTDTILHQLILLNEQTIFVDQIVTTTHDILKRFDRIAAAVYKAKTTY